MSRKFNLQERIALLRFEKELVKDVPCPEEENEKYAELLKEGGELPENVYQYMAEDGQQNKRFYRLEPLKGTEQEMIEYLLHKELEVLKTIKSCIVFFTVLMVIGLIVGLILALDAL